MAQLQAIGQIAREKRKQEGLKARTRILQRRRKKILKERGN
jgi:hypothetical protein